ncbi:MAG: CocE/NonD family hydrolase, partial [Acetobacteraceae bacterium]|nr:CocE/NonD family hydrolase [Acetobacteraceae bacterium]
MDQVATPEASLEVHENLWIPLADGRRLAARMWVPVTARGHPVPAVIEYVPYRKRDATRARDELIHPWLATHGYACLRVDMHGSGDSDGILRQEFQPQEREDALEMIAWAAAQDWCDGGVAMLGKSWGAYAALHAAMCRPPALKAIIPVCGGDDRYDQSLHYTGGAVLNQTLWWTDIMQIFNMRPPDPAISGADWEHLWQARLEAAEPWLAEWLRHQRRDEFWQENSVPADGGGITCAVFAVGGWADYISRSVPRLLDRLRCRRWGLVGPWGHHYPHEGVPGPAIGFLQECRRFLDTVCKGSREYDDVPMFRSWIADFHAPGPMHIDQTGQWAAEVSWPSPRIGRRVLYLNARGLGDAEGDRCVLSHRSPQTVGLCAPEWLSQGVPGEAPLDQRVDDGRSLCFDTLPMSAPVAILGSAVLELELAVDQPVGLLAARLNDVAPDGTSLRVALGILNLTHRDSDAVPTPMIPGQRTRVTLTLPETGYRFAAGHRIRIALSTTYWPVVWPSPRSVLLALFAGACRLVLPVRAGTAEDATVTFDPPESAPALPIAVLEPAALRRTTEEDLLTGVTRYVVEAEGGLLGPARRFRIEPTGTVMGHAMRQCFEIAADDPISARAEITQIYEMERGDWAIRLQTATRF